MAPRGAFNAVLMMIVSIGALLTAVPLFIGCFMLGIYVIPRATPTQLMYAGDGVIAAFLFFWGVGVITELQRTRAAVVIEVHALAGVDQRSVPDQLCQFFVATQPDCLCAGVARIERGSGVDQGNLLIAGVAGAGGVSLMVTALTYQFQGWLASLMSNPRRRRTVIVVSTMVFVLCAIAEPDELVCAVGSAPKADRSRVLADELARLQRAAEAGEFDAMEHVRRQKEVMDEQKRAAQEADRASVEQWAGMVRAGKYDFACGVVAIWRDGRGRGTCTAGDSGVTGHGRYRIS